MNATTDPVPSMRQCDSTIATAVEPSVKGWTPRCHPGPCSGSIGMRERASSHSLSSERGQAVSAMSIGRGAPVAATQRCRPNGTGDRSMYRATKPLPKFSLNRRKPSRSTGPS